MEELNIDLTMLAAIWMAAVVIIIPVMGWTARLTVGPTLQAISQWRRASPGFSQMERRLAEVEAELARLQTKLDQADS
ncbi:MAG TPA: hypothetical protein VFI91_09215 [Longimicrobiaceae bacterium]|nr:hypothetical protein [Longimicrobiaceae bacterium]